MKQFTLMEQNEYFTMFALEKDLWWYRGLRHLLLYYVRNFGKKLKILDAGCGTGITMQCLHRLNHNVCGIDASPDAVTLARSRGLTRIQKASVTSLPYQSNYFDAVLNLDVIGLLDKKQISQALNEFERVLKPGGHLILQTAALEWLRSQHDDVSRLRTRYTKSQLESLFQSKSWKIVKIGYRVFLLFIPVALVKIIKKFVRLKNDSEGDLFLPPPIFNITLYLIQKLENMLFPYLSFPIGTSLFIVVQKNKK